MLVVAALYLSAALHFFYIWLRIWLKAFQQETDLCNQQKLICMKVLIIATIFWPLVVPISYLHRNKEMELLASLIPNQLF
ncbi:MAG: hypothetical protein F6K58_21730 [Symploca sp. SIO2E9]|nr:hypothetical protein [Symploca sp. SIO2E9]